ncbi:MAG: hypothetical protein IPI67_01575 [Myxococcales bacterium]|nr:hypothetical protein [Myxococcales bacterium]
MTALRRIGTLWAIAALGLGPTRAAYAEGEPARAALGAGVAIPVLNHALYGPGVLAQGGADLPLGDGQSQRLRFLGRWIGLATTGARADIGSLEAAFRLYPKWGRGLLFEVGTGALFEVERLQLNLPGRSLDESNTRFGMPATAAAGFGLGRRIELEAGYAQLLFFREQPRTVGIVHVSIGGRL